MLNPNNEEFQARNNITPDRTTNTQEAPPINRQKSRQHGITRKLPLSNKVCRCLFPPDTVEDEAVRDNIVNALQESKARDNLQKNEMWSFDFKNEVALQGRYEWSHKTEAGEWIRMRVKNENVSSTDDADFLSQQSENERTPVQPRENTMPNLQRKRRRDSVNGVGNPVKRKVNFDKHT